MAVTWGGVELAHETLLFEDFVSLTSTVTCHRRSSGRASHAACSPPTYSYAAAPARRVSTIIVACATAGPLGCPCTPSTVHHRCSSVFSRRVAPAWTTASRLRRAIAPPSHHRAPIATLRLLDAAAPPLRCSASVCSPPPPPPLRRTAAPALLL
ncbi:hypothetical protein U1Q18_006156 [Sarracenia purpurea var. burkii]